MRTPFQYYGGKSVLVKKILPIINSVKCSRYVEPFCGSAAVFFAKPKVERNVLNDLDERVIKALKFLQNLSIDDYNKVFWTPYARQVLGDALKKHENGTLDGYDFFSGTNVSINGWFYSLGNWRRKFIPAGGISGNCNDWLMRINFVPAISAKLAGVAIENRDGIDVILEYDSEDTLFYLDPPYIKDTRSEKDKYFRDQDDSFHKKLVGVLLKLKGKFVLSGYDHEIYRLLNENFTRIDIKTSAYCTVRKRTSKVRGKGSAKKYVPATECLWYNF